MSSSSRLEVRDLHVTLASRTVAVRGVSFGIGAGEMVGLVGESGSGKSITLRAVAGILPFGTESDVLGTVQIMGTDVSRLSVREARALRRAAVGYVFQDSLAALNPSFKVGWQLNEALRYRMPQEKARDRRLRVLQALERVELADLQSIMRSYPHQLSGGMRQRVGIAMALLSEPSVLLADEPTTALDVTLAADILDLLDQLRRESGLGVLLVSHDLNLVVTRCQRVLVMYGGSIVEEGEARELFAAPAHPYTAGLLAATVDPFLDDDTDNVPIPGEPGVFPPRGCRFAPRCHRATEQCREVDPEITPLSYGEGHRVACHHPIAPYDLHDVPAAGMEGR